MSTGDQPQPGFGPSSQPSGDTMLADSEYEMKNSTRGIFVILNHENFDKMRNGEGKEISPTRREGTSFDKAALEKTFRQLGFDVEPWDDLTRDEVIGKMNEYAKMDHQNYDCFGCAVLSHGEKNDVIFAKDALYNLKEIMHPFRMCRTLDNKPKLFFIQACRGNDEDFGNIIRADRSSINEEEDHTKDVVIPIEANFLVSYSTTEGYQSRRNVQKGSWYIQVLADYLLKYGDQELLHILTLVNREVCLNRGTVTADKSKRRQAPTIVSRLTGLVHFRQSDNCPSRHEHIMMPLSESSTSTAPSGTQIQQLEEKFVKMLQESDKKVEKLAKDVEELKNRKAN